MKKETTALMHIRPLFLCSFTTGEICLMNDAELLECSRTRRIPVDRVKGKLLTHFVGEEKPFTDYDQVYFNFSSTDALEKIDEMRKTINVINYELEHKEAIDVRTLRNSVKLFYRTESGLTKTAKAKNLNSISQMRATLGETGEHGGVFEVMIDHRHLTYTEDEAQKVAESFLT